MLEFLDLDCNIFAHYDTPARGGFKGKENRIPVL